MERGRGSDGMGRIKRKKKETVRERSDRQDKKGVKGKGKQV